MMDYRTTYLSEYDAPDDTQIMPLVKELFESYVKKFGTLMPGEGVYRRCISFKFVGDQGKARVFNCVSISRLKFNFLL